MNLKTYDFEKNSCVDESTFEGPFEDLDYPFTWSNDNQYLLLPSGHLLMQPKGLASHLNCKELLGLLILEQQQKTQQQPPENVLNYLLQNRFPKIKELIAARYAIK